MIPTFSKLEVIGLLASVKVMIGWWLRVEIFASSWLDSGVMVAVEGYGGWILEDGCGVAINVMVGDMYREADDDETEGVGVVSK